MHLVHAAALLHRAHRALPDHVLDRVRGRIEIRLNDLLVVAAGEPVAVGVREGQHALLIPRQLHPRELPEPLQRRPVIDRLVAQGQLHDRAADRVEPGRIAARALHLVEYARHAQQQLDLGVGMGHPRDRAVILDADHQLPAIRVRHGAQRLGNIAGNIRRFARFRPRAGTIPCRLPLEELSLFGCLPAGDVVLCVSVHRRFTPSSHTGRSARHAPPDGSSRLAS